MPKLLSNLGLRILVMVSIVPHSFFFAKWIGTKSPLFHTHTCSPILHSCKLTIKSMHIRSWDNFILIPTWCKFLKGLFILTRVMDEGVWCQWDGATWRSYFGLLDGVVSELVGVWSPPTWILITLLTPHRKGTPLMVLK